MAEVAIKNFKGINLEEGLWKQGFARFVKGIDLFGLQDNTATGQLSIPGVLQCARAMLVGTEAAATNDITDLITAFAYYPTTDTVWGLSNATGGGSGRLYERAAGTWTLRRSSADAPSTGNTAGGGGLVAFAGKLYQIYNGGVNSQSGAVPGTWASVGSFTTGGSTPRPSKAFGGNLFIGNDRYISKIDSAGTFTAAFLTLPADVIVRSIEIYQDIIFISADNLSTTGTVGSYTRIYRWDGVSSTFDSVFDILDEPIAPFLKHNEGYLWAIGARGSSTPGNPVYVFNGSTFSKIFMLPFRIGGNNDVVGTYKGGIIVASNETGAASFEDGVGGVWMLNRYDSNHPFQAVLFADASAGMTNVQVGAVFSSGLNIYVSTKNTTTSAFEVWELHATTENTTGIWQSLPIDVDEASRDKVWHAIKIDSELSNTGVSQGNLVVKYRRNYATSWTTLKTLTNVAAADLNIPLGVTAKVIEIRLELSASAGTSSTKVHGFTLFYTPTTQ